MKILYITTVAGTMSFFKYFINDLVDNGNQVDLACNIDNRQVEDCFLKWGCEVIPLPCSRYPMDFGNMKTIAVIRNIVKANGYDLVHCHTPIAAACTRIACKGLRKNGLKVYYTAHGFHFYKGAPKKNWLIYYPVEKYCAHFTDVLITINREDYALAKKKMKAKKVIYVPGVGIDLHKFSNVVVDRKMKRNELGIPENATLLLSVGELKYDKNHEVMVRALAKLNDRNIHYMIAGQGNKHDYLLRLAENLGVGNQLHLLGYRSDIPELLWVSDLFVFPSVFEGLPVSLMEAMAAGIPVVCSAARGNTDLITDKNYQFRYDSVDGLVKVIQYALCHDNSNYIEKNLKRLEMYQKSEVLKDMVRIYEEVEKEIHT